MDGLKERSKRQKGDILDKRFGKDAFDAGLKEAEDRAIKEGVDPGGIKGLFDIWWDEQFAKEEGQTFQKFQDRAEFQTPEPAPASDDVDVSQLSDEALDKLIKAR